MEQMQQIQGVAEQVRASLPMWLDFVLAFLGVWGIFLWLFGRRLVRPSMSMLGLVAGGLASGLIAREYTSGAVLAGWALGGGVAGGLLIWVTFRIWIGLTLAIMLGAATPWAVLAWEGAPWPIEAGQTLRDAANEAIDNGTQQLMPGEHQGPADQQDPPKPRDTDAGAADADAGADGGPGVLDKLAALARDVTEDLRQWWAEDLDSSVRWLVTVVAGAVAVGGLTIGLLLPNLGASLAASLVGSALIGGVALRLTARYLEAAHDWLPSSPRAALITLAAMTIIGTVIQWTVTGRRTDK